MLFILDFHFTLAPFTQYNAKLYSSDILMIFSTQTPGADPGFQVRGRTWKNCAEWREVRKFLGYFVWKITILRQKNHIFSNFRGARAGCAPWIRPWSLYLSRRHHRRTGPLGEDNNRIIALIFTHLRVLFLNWL